jgi:hypothetical protein
VSDDPVTFEVERLQRWGTEWQTLAREYRERAEAAEQERDALREWIDRNLVGDLDQWLASRERTEP